MRHDTLRPLTPDEINDPEEKKKRDEFDAAITAKLGPAMTPEDLEEYDSATPQYDAYEDEDGGGEKPAAADDDPTPEYADMYIGADVVLPVGDTMMTGTVRGHERDSDGSLLGKSNPNPMLDTRTYNVEFLDGSVSAYGANVIAERYVNSV